MHLLPNNKAKSKRIPINSCITMVDLFSAYLLFSRLLRVDKSSDIKFKSIWKNESLTEFEIVRVLIIFQYLIDNLDVTLTKIKSNK